MARWDGTVATALGGRPVSTAGKVLGTVEPLRSRDTDAVQALPFSWGSGMDLPDPDFWGR